MHKIKIDEVVLAFLREHGRFGDSYNDVLRRLLGLSPTRPGDPLTSAATGALMPLIAAGAIHAGDSVTWRRPRLGEVHTATVGESGHLITADGGVFATPDMAASAVAGYPSKGWPYWQTADGTSLQHLREAAATTRPSGTTST